MTVSTIIAICLSHIGQVCYRCFPPPSPTNTCTSYFSIIIKAYVLSMLTNMLKSESCFIHWKVQVSCLRLELFNHYSTRGLTPLHDERDILNEHLYLLALTDFYIIMYSIRYDLPSIYILLRIGEELYKLHASVLILILLFQFVFTMYKLI